METNLTVYDKVNDVPSIVELGKAIAKSGMFGCENVEQGTVLALQCIAERKPPLELAKTYHIISGKLSKRADAMLADFRRAGGKFVIRDLKNTEVQSAKVEWEGECYEVSFSTQDAERAGLLPARKGSGWEKYPAAMLRARLISETLRAIAPEIVQGAYTPEEIADFSAQPTQAPIAKPQTVDADVIEVTPARNSSATQRQSEYIEELCYKLNLDGDAKLKAFLWAGGDCLDGDPWSWEELTPEQAVKVTLFLEKKLKDTK